MQSVSGLLVCDDLTEKSNNVPLGYIEGKDVRENL